VIDLHCHLLPGIDDGPADAGVSVAVAEAAYYDGVKVIAATPHAREDHPAVVASELEPRCEKLRHTLRVQEVPMEVVSGAEVDLAWALGASEQDLVDVTYGRRGTDVLVETPHGLLPPGFEDRLHDVFTARGIRVLLAHPERSRVYQEDPRRLARLLERGVLTQVTAQALVSGNRGAGAKLARALVAEGVAHVIATDAHRPEMRASLSDAIAGVSRGDQARAEWMVTDAPAAILAGEPLPAPPQGRRHLLRKRLG
jgi:protein-tyrosine phosphatase